MLFRRLLPALLSCLLPIAAAAHMTLDSAASSLGFVSVKNGSVAESHRFSGLAGRVGRDGVAHLVIDLASVDTGIGIRDERMREHLFEVAEFPTAQVQVAVDTAAVLTLGAGESLVQEVQATLVLHGRSASVPATVVVTRLADGGVQVVAQRPVVVQAAAFGLSGGLDILKDLAGLAGITPAVPVTFSLVYRPSDD